MRAFIFALLLACAAHADWEGRLVTRGTPFDGPPDHGVRAAGSGWKLRFEIRRESDVIVTLFDLRKGELIRFIGGDYEPVPIEPDKSTLIGGNPPAPCAKSVAGCLRKSGFTKRGQEKVNGHPATKWQRGDQTLWVADDAAEFLPLKQVTHELGHTVSFDVLGVKVAPQDPAQFGPPKGSKKFKPPPAMD